MDIGGGNGQRLGFGAVLVGVGAVLALAGCSGGDDRVRTVLVDYVHEDVASSFLAYFPKEVTVHPGDTVRFTQEWTGEPHTVTLGRLADEVLTGVLPLFEQYAGVPDEEIPAEAFEAYDSFVSLIPPIMDDDFDGGPVNQNVAQPCFLDQGGPPEDPMTPCTDEQQVQPEFTGRQTFYNSGFIDYKGEGGNVFTVKLSDDIAPGTYYYYCVFHGPFQNGSITVVAPDEPIPSQQDVARQAKAEIDAMAAPLIDALEVVQSEDAAGDTQLAEMGVQKPLAGWWVDDPEVHAFISEFVPAQKRIKVGETLTWSFVGGHTVSFNPPDYFSELVVEDDGTVVFSEDALQPRGGPGMPPMPEGDGEGGEGEGPPEPIHVEVGPWDGTGFLSSGMFWTGQYSVTFTEPGEYPYACLVHPQMVGTVIVEEG